MVRKDATFEQCGNIAPDFTDDVLAAAEQYAKLGWRVVPLAEKSKKPILTAWQTNASADMDVIQEWWKQTPRGNIGVQLGPRSGIIDIETDSREAELALQELFRDNFPVTCAYRSTRGTHRLFKWREGMIAKAMTKIDGIEFRLGNGDLGAQSVFPPSIHSSGNRYQWIVSPDECDPVELPDHVFALLREHNATERDKGTGKAKGKPASHFAGLLKGVSEGGRNQSAAELIGRVLADMADPFDNAACLRQYEFVRLWNNSNQPPLDDRELRRTFESILGRERQKRQSQFPAAYVGGDVDPATAPTPAAVSTAIAVRQAAELPESTSAPEIGMEVQLELETLRRKLGIVRVTRDSDDPDAVYSVELSVDGSEHKVAIGDARKVKSFTAFKTAVVAATRRPFSQELKPGWDRLSDAILIASVTQKKHSAADTLSEWLEAFVVTERHRLYPQRHHERFDLGFHTLESALARKADERSFVAEGGMLWLKATEFKRFIYQNFQETVKVGDLTRMLEQAGFQYLDDTPMVGGKRVHIRYWLAPVPG
ncbi:MAG: bifunctional DNA primase/polymerase, partial [Planctomycetaceae bacterium]|nr:bifunctional DNA primase/polymerase [Planctomycetaceae bacterium]